MTISQLSLPLREFLFHQSNMKNKITLRVLSRLFLNERQLFFNEKSHTSKSTDDPMKALIKSITWLGPECTINLTLLALIGGGWHERAGDHRWIDGMFHLLRHLSQALNRHCFYGIQEEHLLYPYWGCRCHSPFKVCKMLLIRLIQFI